MTATSGEVMKVPIRNVSLYVVLLAVISLGSFAADTATSDCPTRETTVLAPCVVWAQSVAGDSDTTQQRLATRHRAGHMQLPRVMRGMAAAPDGCTYAVGSFFGKVQLRDSALVSAGGADIMLAAFDPAGQVKWFKSFGGTGADYGFDVACDSRGAVLITGMCSAGTHFDEQPTPSRGVSTCFTAKLDKAGKTLWVATAGGSRLSGGNEVAVDGEDNILVVANGYEDFTAGTNVFSHAGGMDIYVLKYATDGQLVWARGIAGPHNEMGRGIAGDKLGNVLVVGEFTGVINVDGVTLTAAGDRKDIFAVKYDRDGQRQWAMRFGSTGDDYARGVACDRNGNSYISGVFSAEVVFGKFHLKSLGDQPNIFLAKLSPKGEVLWAQSLPCLSRCEGCEIEVDEAGNSYIAGQFRGTIRIGPQQFTANGMTDMFAAEFDASGRVVWARHLPSRFHAANFALALHRDKRLTLVGTYEGQLELDKFRLAAPEGGGTFIMTLQPQPTGGAP